VSEGVPADAASKAEIREAARAARAELSLEARIAGSAAIRHAVLGLFDLQHARTVAGYMATPEEVDAYEILDALRFRGLRIALPRVEEPVGLSMHSVSEDATLVHSAFGILEPEPMAPVVPTEDIDAAIVPGVAFSPEGDRIGYGGGYYDMLLDQLRSDCVCIGLAFDEQIVDSVPVERHNRPVDVVVTPTRVLRRPQPEIEPVEGEVPSL
jgi:5-formyltetrahydrofolate cyclo-ligase